MSVALAVLVPLLATATATIVVLTSHRTSKTLIGVGYCPVSWAIQSGQNSLPGKVLAVLTMLFPPDHAWIARSDWF